MVPSATTFIDSICDSSLADAFTEVSTTIDLKTLLDAGLF